MSRAALRFIVEGRLRRRAGRVARVRVVSLYYQLLMRIIAGKFRSRGLAAPAGLDTRPTSDRLRETLFNVLAPEIAGATFADLYAGSGAVGIEAISRGAGLVYFVETAEAALDAVSANLKTLKIVSGYGIEPRTVSSFLRRQAQKAAQKAIQKTAQEAMRDAAQEAIQGVAQKEREAAISRKLDIVFLDPPYESDAEYADTLAMLGGECAAVLSEQSIVIAEHSRRKPLLAEYASLRRYRLLEQGDATLSFYRSLIPS